MPRHDSYALDVLHVYLYSITFRNDRVYDWIMGSVSTDESRAEMYGTLDVDYALTGFCRERR